MLIGINIAIEQPAHPDAVVAAKRDIAAQRRLEIDTGSGDRVGNLAVEQTCPVIGFEQAGVAGRRLIEIGAVGRSDRDPALPSAPLLQSMEKGVYRLPLIDGLIALFGQQRVCSLECAVRFAILVIFEQRAREFELTGEKIGLELQQARKSTRLNSSHTWAPPMPSSDWKKKTNNTT